MGQLDELELGKSIGRIEQKVDSLIVRFDFHQNDTRRDIDLHDKHIQTLLADQSERKGANHVWYLVYSFCAIGFWKLVEHVPSIIKSIIG